MNSPLEEQPCSDTNKEEDKKKDERYAATVDNGSQEAKQLCREFVAKAASLNLETISSLALLHTTMLKLMKGNIKTAIAHTTADMAVAQLQSLGYLTICDTIIKYNHVLLEKGIDQHNESAVNHGIDNATMAEEVKEEVIREICNDCANLIREHKVNSPTTLTELATAIQSLIQVYVAKEMLPVVQSHAATRSALRLMFALKLTATQNPTLEINAALDADTDCPIVMSI